MAKILYVDDDIALAEMVKDWLVFEEHAVTVVHVGFEGWKQIQTNEYDLAILDWELPDLHGIEILKRFRAGGGTTPVVMLTSRGSVDDKEAGLDSGANDYLTKPFHMKELSARIRAVMRNQTAAIPAPKSLGTGNEEILKRGNLQGSDLASRYEFLEIIGEGGVAMVFKARHPHLQKMVAIKMLHASEMSDNTVARFQREAQAISAIDHPNIIMVYDFGVTERKQPFMVMELIQGRSLETVLRDEDFLPLQRGLDILIPVGEGLSQAHDCGILHRDIKPDNIMLKEMANRPPIPKILDFGLAKLKDPEAQKAIKLTQTQHINGSPPYMSPEQVLGRTLDERSDVYSFGCVIFETLSGYSPHVGTTAMEIMIKHVEQPPLTFEQVRPDLAYPEELKQLVAKSVQKDPDDRYQNMRELTSDLQKLALQLR
jgi:CheY-like chemotaxis protein/tRNA A-37 threonylcarbamoyl transferase component Bud32